MHNYVFWLGTNAELSRLELFNVLLRNAVPYRTVSSHERFVMIEINKELKNNFIAQLGGVDRIGKVIGQQKTNWDAKALSEMLPPTDKKMMVGLSKFNLPQVNLVKLAKELKKLSRQAGIKLNYVVPQGRTERLNAAQVLFNSLYKLPNSELTIWSDNGVYYVARTEQVQDIQAYEKRDTSRPERDAKVGLLPPKLAQIMLNLIPDTSEALTIYDPCCGMGTLLQEGWLMGHRMIGSDISERMVHAAATNLQWLADNFPVNINLMPKIFNHDINHSVAAAEIEPCDAVVTEPYLGPPLLAPLSATEALNHHHTLLSLYRRLFINIKPVLKQNGWVIIILPAIVNQDRMQGPLTLFPREFIDEVETIGYSFKQFGKKTKGIIYSRPDAIVAREITVWQKK